MTLWLLGLRGKTKSRRGLYHPQGSHGRELRVEQGLSGSWAVSVRQRVDKDSITQRAVTDVE